MRKPPKSPRPHKAGPHEPPRREHERPQHERPQHERHGSDHRARKPDRAHRPNGVPGPSIGRAALLYGIHAIGAAWTNPERVCRHLYGTEQALVELAPALEAAAERGIRRPQPIRLDRDAIERLLPPGSVHQGLALDSEPLPERNLDDVLIAMGGGPGTIVVLDQVTDPHNVGAILRSAAAFGAAALVVQKRHAPEITGTLAKAASGAVEVVPVLRETNLARALEAMREAGFSTIGLDERGQISIAEAEASARAALVLGAEGAGLRRLVAEGCTTLARLPTQPPISSLNVSNAAAVALYEIARRRA